MTYRLICGAECGLVTAGVSSADSHWGDVTGTPAIETSVVYQGAAAFRFDAAATNPRFDKTLPASQTIAYWRGYFRMTDVTPSTKVNLVVADGVATNHWVAITTGGLIEVTCHTGTPVTHTGVTLANDEWFGLELEFDFKQNPHALKWRVWSAASGWVDQTAAAGAFAADTVPNMQFGIRSGPTSGLSVYLSNIVVASGTTAGEHYGVSGTDRYVGRLLPTADGTHSFTAGDFGYDAAGGDVATNATDVYTYIDDADQTSLADFIRQKTSRSTAYLEVSFANPSASHVPIAVGVTSSHHADGTGANRQSIRVSDDDFTSETQVWNANDVSNTTLTTRVSGLATKPSGGAWTNAALAAIKARFGYSDDVSAVPYWDSISLEYLYEVSANQTVTPTTASLTTATFAPTVTVSDNKSVTPSTAALTLATFAPTVAVSDNQSVTPDTAALTLTTFAPTVTTTAHVTATPDTAALTLATFAPTVTTTGHVTATPDTAALTLTTFAPTVTTSGNQVVTPGVASLSMTAFAPSVVITDHKVVTPDPASLSLTAFAPTVTASDHKVVTPSTASLALTTFAPTVTASDHKVVTPPAAALALTAFAPTVTTTGGFDYAHATATVTLSALSAASVTVSEPDSATVSISSSGSGVVTI